MPTAGIVDGKLLVISIGGAAVGCQTSATLTVNVGTREVICKDSDDFKSLLVGLKDWSVSGGGLLAFDHALGGMDLVNLALTNPVVTVRWGSTVPGDKYIEGTAILTSVTLEGPNKGENSTYSYEVAGSGVFTIGTNV